MIKKITISIIVLILIIIAYIKYALSKLTYDYEILAFKAKKIDLKTEAIFEIQIDIKIFNPMFFKIPVNYLYYEIYYNGNLLGKSADTSGFVLEAKKETVITQKVDIRVQKGNLDVVKNYIAKTPTTYTAKVIAGVFGIKIKLTDIKFTY